jgi:hypothetical protein
VIFDEFILVLRFACLAIDHVLSG